MITTKHISNHSRDRTDLPLKLVKRAYALGVILLIQIDGMCCQYCWNTLWALFIQLFSFRLEYFLDKGIDPAAV